MASSDSNSAPSRPPLSEEIRDDEQRFVPGVFDALREITVDCPGGHVERLHLNRELSRWIKRQGGAVPPLGAFNRILRRAGYRRGTINSMSVVHGLQLVDEDQNK